MVARSNEVRCPTCGKLLAVKADKGGFEIKLNHKVTIKLEIGEITCEKCESVTRIDASVPYSSVITEMRLQSVPLTS